MGTLRHLYQATRERIFLILASLPLAAFGILLLLEARNTINYINVSWPLNSSEFSQVAGGLLSAFLTYALVVLYWQQKKVQENQHELLKQQHEPYLSGEVAALHIVSAQFKIRNTGSAPAYNVRAEWEIAGQSRAWEIPTLVPSESFGFPILVDDDGNWLLSTDEISDYLNSKDSSGLIDYTITCTNHQGEERKFSDTVDFSVLATRSEANEIWETEPLEEISNELGKMRKDVRKISRYTDREKREVNWRVKTRQTEVILKYVNQFGPLNITDLQELTGIGEHDLLQKVERLDKLGEIDYNETTDSIKPRSGRGPNKSLNDDYS